MAMMSRKLYRTLTPARRGPLPAVSRYLALLLPLGTVLCPSAVWAACYSDSFTYSIGNLGGKGGWTGSVSTITIDTNRVKITGSASSTASTSHTTACGDASSIAWVRIKVLNGVGTGNLWNLYYHDSGGLNLARWSGSGTTSRGMIGSTSVTAVQTLTGGLDELAVKIDFGANTTQFFFNNTSLGSASHASTGAGNAVGIIRFERLTGSLSSNFVYFDDVTVDLTAPTPPAAVSNFLATTGNLQNSLSWLTPGSTYFTGTMIRFRTDAFPTGPTDGTLLIDKAAATGTVDDFTHTGLTNGVTYYYAAFAHDAAPQYSAAATASAAPAPPPAWYGPGLPNRTYPAGELFNIISGITAPDAPFFHATAAMHNGYLVLPFSDGLDGGFCFYNIADPYQPQLVSRIYRGDIREGHAMGFSYSYPGLYAVTLATVGIQFWDWTDVNGPVLLSSLALPEIEGNDYTSAIWWLFWQAPYVYCGGTDKGLYVVDASDPTLPVLVNRLGNGETGGFRVGSVFAVGNLLVLMGNDVSGISLMDISDPANPVLTATNSTTIPYSGLVNGDKVFSAATGGDQGQGLIAYDISSGSAINFIQKKSFSDRGGYPTFQDGYVHIGASALGYYKIDVRNPSSYVTVGQADFVEANTDLDFASVQGNLVILSDDEGNGTRIVPHQTAPDYTPPAVNMVNPKSNAVNQAFTSRVGLTLTDRIDLRSVNSSTFILRPVGGSALPGKYSGQTGVINFWPDAPLLPDTTYEVVVPAGGIRDEAANPTAGTFSSFFSTNASVVTWLCQLVVPGPQFVGQSVAFNVTNCTGTGPFTYSWSFGDGTPTTAFSATSSATHTYANPGHFTVIVIVKNAAGQRAFHTVQTIIYPPTAGRPAHSSTIACDAGRNRVWNVNADSNTVTCIDAAALTKIFEQPVGTNPRTLAVAPDGSVWVANQDSGTVSVLNSDTGQLLTTIALPYGSRPYGIAFSLPGGAAYLTLEGTGQLVKLDPVARAVVSTVSVGPSPRGIAISHDGARIFVSRFISPADHGEVVEVSGAGLNVVRTFTLAVDPGPDTASGGRGVPNYIFTAEISPDGRRAWLPSKKDNTGRGLFVDGQPLTFENTVRTIVSQLDLLNNNEALSARRDLDNRGLAAAASFNQLGDYIFVATLASNTVDVLDAATGETATSINNVGLAPNGLTLNAGFTRLFVHNDMSRDVAVYGVTDIGIGNSTPLLARITTVQTEPLSAQLLQGKQIFHNAADPRMSRDNYLGCVVCHLDGDSDGRVWDFTDRGEGLRNTIVLTGRAGMRQGPVHWSANFNEIQDFENDIRSAFGGKGFMSDADFNTSNRYLPLGGSKKGFSAELDALAAYVSSFKRVHASPFRNADGSMTADAVAGEQIFRSAATGCTACHRGPQLTDSELYGNPFVLHNVGTLTPASGQRLGAMLMGIDTPGLKGVWETAPYLHDGSAATLMDVITTKNPIDQHGQTSHLTAGEKLQLVAFLQQIENIARTDFDGDGDTDQSDYGHFQGCFTSDFALLPGCDWANLDGNLGVDGADFNIFNSCATGPGLPADLSCAE